MDDPFGGRENVVLALESSTMMMESTDQPIAIPRIVFLSFYFCSSCCTTLSLSLSLGDERVRE